MRVSDRFNLTTSRVLLNLTSHKLLTDDRVGVEVELEGFGARRGQVQEQVDPRWDVVSDGSLRNGGLEFVFKEPMFGMDVVETLDDLFSKAPSLAREGTLLTSSRTSVHVHLDVRDMDFNDILSTVVIYMLCERFMFEKSGNRQDSMYCVPLASSPEYLRRIALALGTPHQLGVDLFKEVLSADSVKYSAMNLAPVSSQGSIEFRHHEGVTDSGSVIKWINMILAIKQYAINIGYPSISYIESVVTGTRYQDFIRGVFKLPPSDAVRGEWGKTSLLPKLLMQATRDEGNSIKPMSNLDARNRVRERVGMRLVDGSPVTNERLMDIFDRTPMAGAFTPSPLDVLGERDRLLRELNDIHRNQEEGES